MSFVDRLSGQSVEQPPETSHFGRWLFDPSEGPGQINAQPASDGDVLAPGATGDWAFLRVGDTIPVRGRFFADALPVDQDADALRELGRMLREPVKAAGGWLEWSETSPLAPGLDEAVKPHPLEDSIEAEIGHLAAVCRKPRTHIRREADRVIVARARRIARDAPARLASHTEDWEHRTMAGIQPRRILADVREERWDLYENRVAVRLVDDLVAWLRRRIAEVRRIRDDVYARLEQVYGSASGTRHREHRIYTLWGEGWNDSLGDVAESTLKRLEFLLYKLLGLMDSRLYRHIPGRARAPGGLRTTNLFGNDEHYRGVARLWHKWSRRPVPTTPSPSELWAQYQDLHLGFDAWCMLVVVRACSQLCHDPSEDGDWESEIRPGSTIRLDQHIQIVWEPTGTITLATASEDRPLLRFVPLIHGLEKAMTPEAVNARIAPLVEAVANEEHWTIILHAATPGEPPHPALAGVGNPPFPGTRGAVDFIRVSPFSLDSVERVSRAIRWATLVPRMLAYPPRLQDLPQKVLRASPELQGGLATNKGPWRMRRSASGSWDVVEQPPRVLFPVVARCLNNARADRDRLEEKRQEVQDRMQQNRSNRRRMAELNRQKTSLLEPMQEAEDRVSRLETLDREINEAHHDLGGLAICPACGTPEAQFEAREDGCFAALCRSSSCKARWELRHDPEAASGVSGEDGYAKSRIPVFLRGDADSAERPDDAAPQWVDDNLGCDVLAIPRESNVSGFLAPRAVPRSP